MQQLIESAKEPRSFGTHDGSFHADEVTACALLLICDLIDVDRIVRSRDLSLLSRCEYICDVGGYFAPEHRLFDHHQSTYNGPLSSAGMILEYLKNHKYLSVKEYELLNNSLVRGIDAHDNGRDPLIPGFCTFSHLVSNFSPIQYDVSREEQFAAFMEAVTFVKSHIQRMLARFKYNLSCRQIVADCMAQYKDCLIFEQGIPWMESFFELGGAHHPALFVIMPSGGHWKLRGIPPSHEERMRVRKRLPKAWAGLIDQNLKTASQIPGAIFCHKGRFISVWETKEDALKAFELTLKLAKENPYDA